MSWPADDGMAARILFGKGKGTWFSARACACVRRNTCLSLLYLRNSSYFAVHSCYDCLRTEADGGCRLLGCVMSPWDDSETTFCVRACRLFSSNLIPHHEKLLRMDTTCCASPRKALGLDKLNHSCNLKTRCAWVRSNVFNSKQYVCVHANIKRGVGRGQQENQLRARQAQGHPCSRGVLVYR